MSSSVKRVPFPRPVVRAAYERAGQGLPDGTFRCEGKWGCGMAVPRSGTELDHITEVTDGGSNELTNAAVLCIDCHAAKTAKNRTARAKAARRVPWPVRVVRAVGALIGLGVMYYGYRMTVDGTAAAEAWAAGMRDAAYEWRWRGPLILAGLLGLILWVRAATRPDKPTLTVPDTAPAPVTATPRLEEGIREALTADAATVQVTAETDGEPTRMVVNYPPRIAVRAQAGILPVTETLRTLHPAGADSRLDWIVRHEPRADRYVAELKPDPLDRHIPLPPIEDDPDLYDGVWIGETEDGAPFRVPLLGGAHVFIAGATGAGKGSFEQGIIRGVRTMIRDGRLRLHCADPKGGMELGPLRSICTSFAVTEQAIAKMLTDLVVMMEEKATAAAEDGLRKFPAPTTAMPADLVIVDELSRVVGEASSDPAAKKLSIAALNAMLAMGRAPMLTVVGTLQNPRAKNVEAAAAFTYRIALRTNKATETNMILGEGVRATGAAADKIPEGIPGIAYVQHPDRPGTLRVRTPFITDDDLAETVAAVGPIRHRLTA